MVKTSWKVFGSIVLVLIVVGAGMLFLMREAIATYSLDQAQSRQYARDLGFARTYLVVARIFGGASARYSFIRGNESVLENDFEGSVLYFKEALVKNYEPRTHVLWKLGGHYLFQKNDAAQALSYLLELRTLLPNDAHVSRAIAMAYFNIGDAKTSLPYAEKAVENLIQGEYSTARLAEVLFALGRTQYVLENYSAARDSFQRAAKLDPQNEQVVAWLGRSLRDLGDLKEAKNISLRYLTSHPDSVSVLCSLAGTYNQGREYVQAIEVAEKVLAGNEEVDALNIVCLHHLAIGKYEIGKREEAKNDFEKVLAKLQFLGLNSAQYVRVEEIAKGYLQKM